MITPRENIMKVFRHEQPEWIPLCGHCDPYNQPSREGMDPELARALGTVTWHDESTVLFSRYLGLDIMDHMTPPLQVNRSQVTVESVQKDEDTITKWQTPVGELQEVRKRCREDGTSYCVEHLIKGPQDLGVLAFIFEDEAIALDRQALARMNARHDFINNDGIMMCFMPGTPLGMMYRVYCGVETLIYLHFDAPQTLRDLFTVMEKNYQRQFQLAVQTVADAFVTMDDTSTTIISPAMFESYNMEYTNVRADICHQEGKLYFHHSCGLIRDLLPLYRRTSMDAVHAFTAPPIGNVTIAEGRRELSSAITIITDTHPLAQTDTNADKMKTAIRQIFSQAFPGDHFILNVVAYPHKNMAETKAVVDECRKYQKLTSRPV